MVITGCIGLALLASAQLTTDRPNVVIFLADDLGRGSAGCYGAPADLLATPNIDRLAKSGVRFTRAHSPSAVCSPSRYGLLTGRYYWRKNRNSSLVKVTDPLAIDAERPTIATFLGEQGYTTAIIGKWHLGFGRGESHPKRLFGPSRSGPLAVGFDYFFGVPNNHGDKSGIYLEGDSVWGKRSDKIVPIARASTYGRKFLGIDAPQRVDEEVMDRLVEKAVTWLDAQPEEKPVFLYFAATAVHEPITPSARFTGTCKAGPYAEYIQDVDWSLGQLMDALDRSGRSENTLFIFTSDNGGVRGDESDETSRRRKHNYFGYLARQAGLEYNGNVRGGKGMIEDGGTAVPYVVSWPGRLLPRVTDTRVNLVDTFATVAEALELPLPDKTNGAEDSVSVYPACLGEPMDRTDAAPFVTRCLLGTFAIREGDWKYVEGVPTSGEGLRRDSSSVVRALYNVCDDPFESANLVESHRDRSGELQKKINAARSSDSSRLD
jgi:arylsulfatase A-like enzyme